MDEDSLGKCSDTENLGNNVEISKKRRHSSCQDTNIHIDVINKTPTKNNVVLLKVTPSPSKSPLQKKTKNCRKTPVKNLLGVIEGLVTRNLTLLLNTL